VIGSALVRTVVRFPHPLAGPVDTPFGRWTVVVVKDEDDGRMRTFTLRLLAPEASETETEMFLVRVPRTVIREERKRTWAEDLKRQLAIWIVADMTLRGEITWWPPAPTHKAPSA
jgi:hypothetical protein